MNAYRILEDIRKDLDQLIKREEAKHLMDSDLVTGHLDLLIEALDVIDQCVYFDGS
tara:strand:+ start:105 stop:272 length:168 start_codon:yes stop_codon:yes gene_type:complete